MTRPAITPTTIPIGMPIHGVTSSFTRSSVTVYAPRPKNDAWPNEMRPE